MPQTLAQKLLSANVGHTVADGDIIIADIDLVFAVDSSGPLVFRQFADMGLDRVAHPERAAVFLDHNVPSPRVELSQEQQFLREAAARHGIRLFDVGAGICHQIILEELARPGELTIGAESHTCTVGALCNFGAGMGASDVAVALGTGKTWLRVPETIEVRLTGRLPDGVFAKDLALELEGIVGADGATYKALEFTGETVQALAIPERATLANMAVEMGAKVGLFPSDAQTAAWLKEQGRANDYRAIACDAGAPYERRVEIDCSALDPLVACPHEVDNVKRLSEVQGTRIHQVFIGTCTNARLEDIAIAAHVLKGRQVHPGTRVLVVPSSRTVMREATKRGYIQDLVEAGASVGVPGCAACFGGHMGVPADGENVMSTQNRNFKGRMGNPNAFVYLGSPAVAAAAALTGQITDPREVLKAAALPGDAAPWRATSSVG